MGTEAAVAPSLTVKVVLLTFNLSSSYFPYSLPLRCSHAMSLLSLKIYLYASSLLNAEHKKARGLK